MVHITNIVRNKCCICEREIPPHKNSEPKGSHNFALGDSPLDPVSNEGGIYLHEVCYSSLDRWDLTEKARSLLSAPDTAPLQTID